MNKLTIQSIALILLLAGFPLVSLGTTEQNSVMWWLGLVAIGVGALLPVLTRFLPSDAAKQPAKTRDCGMEYDERAS